MAIADFKLHRQRIVGPGYIVLTHINLGVSSAVKRVHLNRTANVIKATRKHIGELIGICIKSGIVAGNGAGELIVHLLADLGIGDVLPFIGAFDIRNGGIRVVEDFLFDGRHALLGGDGRRAGTVNHSVHGRGERIGRRAVRRSSGIGKEQPIARLKAGKGRVARSRRLPSAAVVQICGNRAQNIAAFHLRVDSRDPGVGVQPIGGILRVFAGIRRILRLNSGQHGGLGGVARPIDTAHRRGSIGYGDRPLENLNALIGRRCGVNAILEGNGRSRTRSKRHGCGRNDGTESHRRSKPRCEGNAGELLIRFQTWFLSI